MSHWQGHVDDAKTKGISCLTIFNPSLITIASTMIFGSRFSLFDFKNIFLLVHMFEQLNLKLGEKLL